MKRLLPSIFCCLSLVGYAQEAAPKWDVELPAPIAASQPAAEPEPIDFTVLSSRTKRMDVTEAAEMPDLPPITGTINVTVQVVADPGLPDPPPALPALPPDDPAVLARLAEFRRLHPATTFLFVSATVFDRSRTLLRIYPNGGTDKTVAAWSNIDFLNFAGFSTYQVKQADGSFRKYGLLMGIGNMDTARMARLAAKLGRAYQPPEIPALPDIVSGGPAFVVVEGDDGSPAMDTLEQVHDLYRKEGARMEEAFVAREKARAERKAFLLANPPKPEDVVIQFWDRKESAGSNVQPQPADQ